MSSLYQLTEETVDPLASYTDRYFIHIVCLPENVIELNR